MSRTGFLLHVYHLQSRDWESLVWGDPGTDKAGTGTKLFECLLDEPIENEVVTVVYSGPSSRDGLTEGAYTKQFLLAHLDELTAFSRFKRRLNVMKPADFDIFKQRVGNIIVGEPIDNTLAEVECAARLFDDIRADRVIHIAAASHAPRCIQIQAEAREAGLIPTNQPWFTVASDISFAGRTPADTMVLEPPHRADDPLLDEQMTLPQVLRPFYALPPQQRVQFLRKAAHAMSELHDSVPDDGGKRAA